MVLKRSAVLAALLAVMAACGLGGASQPPAKIDPQVSLSVEVCTEGEARDSRIYFKNLNDFEWQGVSFSVSKGGRIYTLGDEPQSMQGGREKPEMWPPESTKAAGPFSEPSDFTFRPVQENRGSSHKAPLNRPDSSWIPGQRDGQGCVALPPGMDRRGPALLIVRC